jgi:hypothetical protein
VVSAGTVDDAGGVVIYNSSSAQTIDCNTTYYRLSVMGSGDKTLSGNLTTNDYLTVSTAILDIESNTANIAGSTSISGELKIGAGVFNADGDFNATNGIVDFTNSSGELRISSTATSFGTLDYTMGTVVFDGTSAQSIDETEIFPNLKIDNAAGVTANAITHVWSNGTLTLGNGMLNSDATNYVALWNPVTIANASATSHINGTATLVSQATNEQLLPVGDGTDYRPVVIQPETTTYSTYSATYKNTAHSTVTYDGNGNNITSCGTGVNHIASSCWWDIERSSGGADAYVALNWETGMGIDVPADIVLSHYNSSSSEWESLGADISASNGSGTATASDGRVKSTAYVTDFSPFNLGSGSGNNPLPIDLLSFHTDCSHDIVDVNFSVLSQVNNDYFLIERSEDAIDWEVVGQLDGVEGGNSNTQMDYVFVDNSPLSNLSYYRLTQVDFDGKSKTYYPVSTTCGGSSEGGLPVAIYPNPALNEVTIEMELDNFQGDDVYYTITDATGKAVLSDYVQLDRGFNKHNLDVSKLPNGVYILRFNQTKDHITETRIVKR